MVISSSSSVKMTLNLQPGTAAYKNWCDESIAISANLTDNDKLISELYIEKMDVIPTSIEFRLHDWRIMKVATIQMASAMAIVDGSIPVWNAKYYYNAIRPDTGECSNDDTYFRP